MYDDELETKTEADKHYGASPLYEGALWRANIIARLLTRAKLLYRWARFTVIPEFGARAFLAMSFITVGRLGNAASFVVAIHILSAAFTDSGDTQEAVLSAAIAFALLSGSGSLIGHIGTRLAVKTVLSYEQSCLINGICIRREMATRGKETDTPAANKIVRQAPRMMARAFLQILNLCTSIAITILGLVVCLFIYPVTMGVIFLLLITLSPLYILSAVYSINIGHQISLNSQNFGKAVSEFEKKWLNEEHFDADAASSELSNNIDYTHFHRSYGRRLSLSSQNSLVNSLATSIVFSVSLILIVFRVGISAENITLILIFLSSLRLFSNGLSGIFNGLQTFNTFTPFFLFYIRSDARIQNINQNTSE